MPGSILRVQGRVFPILWGFECRVGSPGSQSWVQALENQQCVCVCACARSVGLKFIGLRDSGCRDLRVSKEQLDSLSCRTWAMSSA